MKEFRFLYVEKAHVRGEPTIEDWIKASNGSYQVTLVNFFESSLVEIVDLQQVLQVANSLASLAMPYEMNFICLGPAAWDPVGIGNHTFPIVKDPPQVLRLVIVLSMLGIEVFEAVDLTGKRSAVHLCLFLDFKDAD